uniref:Cation transporter family protein n=1 Tax=Rhabditophanes sp. KR3021 TaxID=114890 RepID=A0AC35TK24_9BILA
MVFKVEFLLVYRNKLIDNMFFLWLFFSILNVVYSSPAEARLMRDLMNSYVVEERPVIDPATPVVVKLSIALQQIINLNPKEETLELNAWLNYMWIDENLKWDISQYENVTSLRHPYGTIWSSDILLYNSVSSPIDSTFKVNMISQSDGTVTAIPPGILKTSCKMDDGFRYFPFDEVVCYLKLGSWSFHAGQINLVEGGFDLSDYMPNGEWIVLNAWVNKTVKSYECCPEKYEDLKFYLKLRRRTLYYAFNLIMPSILTMILSIIGFALNPESCEKIGLQVSVSLAVTIFSSLLAEMTPQTENLPLIGIFFQTCMVVSIFATSFTVYVQSIHFRNKESHKRMGFWMRYIFLEILPYILRMDHPKRNNNLKTLKKTWIERKKYEKDIRTAFVYNDDTCQVITSLESVLKDNLSNVFLNAKKTKNDAEEDGSVEILQTLDHIYKHLKMIRENTDDEVEATHVKYEWQYLAMVIDRLGLIICTSITLLTIAVFLLRAPYLVA